MTKNPILPNTSQNTQFLSKNPKYPQNPLGLTLQGQTLRFFKTLRTFGNCSLFLRFSRLVQNTKVVDLFFRVKWLFESRKKFA